MVFTGTETLVAQHAYPRLLVALRVLLCSLTATANQLRYSLLCSFTRPYYYRFEEGTAEYGSAVAKLGEGLLISRIAQYGTLSVKVP